MLELLARTYVSVQKLRVGLEHRIRKYEETYKQRGMEPPEDSMNILKMHLNNIYSSEKEIKKTVSKLVTDTGIYKFIENVKGLGTVVALEFLGYIDIDVPSSGKARAYCGLVPGKKKVLGVKSNVNWLLKGKMWFASNVVIMKKDEYYYTLFLAKKWYILNKRGFKNYINDPTKCPKYDECVSRLKKGKRPACKLHCDGMAKRWLTSLLVSHMWEVCRKETGKSITKHTFHIPPKPLDYTHMSDVLSVAVPVIAEGVVPKIDLSDPDIAEEASNIVLEKGVYGLIEKYGCKTEWDR